jgi:hypothetical protein
MPRIEPVQPVARRYPDWLHILVLPLSPEGLMEIILKINIFILLSVIGMG